MLFQDYLNNCLKDEELKKYYLEESLGEDMKEDTRLILPEDDEEVLPEVVLEEPLEVEISQEDLDQALMSQYNNEISNIYNDIDNLNSILVSFDSLDEETKKTIEGIIEERYVHIGLLQSLANDLDPKIKELIDDGELVSDEEDDREILPEDDLEEEFDYTKGHFPVCDSEDDDNDFWNNVYLRSH